MAIYMQSKFPYDVDINVHVYVHEAEEVEDIGIQ